MIKENMRLVEVTIATAEARRKVIEVLDDEGLDYTVSAHADASDTIAEVSFPLPTRTVEPILDRLRDRDVSRDIYTTITEPSVITSREFDQLGDYDALLKRVERHRVCRSELHSQAADLLPGLPTYVLLTVLSAVLVTSGVLLGSITVLVGSMVVSPLIWPPITTSVATVLDDHTLFVRSAKLEAVGLLTAVGSSFGFALLVKRTPLVLLNRDVDAILHIGSYTAPPFLLVIVALSAGIAGALGLGRKNLTTLVGMLAAVAVVLPIGVLGVALAWGRLTIAVGTATVVFLNLLSVTVSGTLILWYMGYHPATWTQLRKTRGTMLRRLLVLGLLVLLLVAFLAQLTSGDLNHLPGIRYG